MKIRTQLKAGGWSNHNETMQVRSNLKAGRLSANHNERVRVRTGLKAGRVALNHNEAIAVRTTLNAGKVVRNHNETLQTRPPLKAGRINLRAAVQTTARKGDRLELLVVRAGLRAGRAVRRGRI